MTELTSIAFVLVAVSIILMVTWRLFYKHPRQKKNDEDRKA